MSAKDAFDKNLINNNVVENTRDLKSRIAQQEVAGNNGIKDGDDIVHSRFITPADMTVVEPTDTGFTGSFMSAVGELFNSILYHVGAVRLGRLQVGFNTSGRFIAGGGNTILDAGGVTNTDNGIGTLLMNANTISASNVIQLHGGVIQNTNTGGAGSVVIMGNGSNIFSDDFEDGTLDAWTLTASPTVAPDGLDGSYCAVVSDTNKITAVLTTVVGNYYAAFFAMKRPTGSGSPAYTITNADLSTGGMTG